MVVLPISSMWSSLLEATIAVPVMPPAPGRLSTTSGWPMRGPISSARMRTEPLPAPPGANGTITVMGRVGHASCARAGTGQSDGAAEAASRPSMARRGSGKAVAEACMAGSRGRRLIRP